MSILSLETHWPSLFTIDTYNNGVNTNTFTVDSSEISKKMSVIRDFGECDKMVFSFEETIKLTTMW